MKKRWIFHVFPLAALVLSGCTLPSWLDNLIHPNKEQEKQKEDKKEDEKPSVIHVSSVTLNKDSLSIEEMQSEQLIYTISPSNAENKEVEWFTSDSNVATVNSGIVYGVAPGTATITLKTVDGNKTDTCSVEITAKEIPVDTITRSICFDDEKPASGDSYEITAPFEIDENITATFNLSEGSVTPKIHKNPKKSSEFDARIYTGNTLTISSSSSNIRNIEFGYGRDDSSGVAFVSDDGKFSGSTWSGNDNEVVFTVTGSGQRRINTITVQYEGSEPDPEEVINLGVKSISEVREYIAENPVKKNGFGNGVNDKRVVTIKGFAIAKIDLVKSSSTYGLDVSEHGKVIIADASGYIGVATQTNSQGTCLWGKIDDHVNESTSKYIVTGYLSEYLGHPEILVTSFQWDKTLEISVDFSVISDATTDLDGFYSRAKDVYYNCAGHGYGEVLTLNNLKCYYAESGSSGKWFYNFTDGTHNLRVNAYNVSSCTVGKNYNIVGITSLKDLSPIIFAFNITASSNQTEIPFDYTTVATSTTVTDFRSTYHGSQNDVDTRPGHTRFDEVVGCYENVYSLTGYLAIVTENNKLYVGISETYRGTNFITGKTAAMASGILLIENDGFWNRTEEQLALFNAFYEDYMCENNQLTMYFVPRQQGYQEGSVCWQVLLIPDFINSFNA